MDILVAEIAGRKFFEADGMNVCQEIWGACGLPAWHYEQWGDEKVYLCPLHYSDTVIALEVEVACA